MRLRSLNPMCVTNTSLTAMLEGKHLTVEYTLAHDPCLHVKLQISM